MDKPKQLGMWMDHSVAYLMEYTTKPFEIQTVICELPAEENELLNSIKKYILRKNRDQIGQILLKYKKIVLFLPDEPKINFFDFLSEDERFFKLKVEIQDIDEKFNNQQHRCIKRHFYQDL
jgi:hypothetical protein